MKKILTLVLCVLVAPIFAGSALAEDPPSSFTDLNSASSSLRTDALQLNPRMTATLTFYTDRAAFEAAAPGITKETFDSGLAGPFSVVACGDPISSAGSGSCFPPGGLETGFSYSSSSNTNIVLLGSGILGLTSPGVAADLFADNATISFSTDVFAAGFDAFGNAGSYPVSVFSAGGLEGSTIVAPGGFFGVISDTPITSIEVGTTGPSNGEIIDNLCYGEICPCVLESSLFADFVNGVAPIVATLECRDDPDNAGILAVLAGGTVAGAASGTKGGRPNQCGTQVQGSPPEFIEITPEQDAVCRALLVAACVPD